MTKEKEKVAAPIVKADQLLSTEAEIKKAMEAAEKNAGTVQKQYQRIALSIIQHLAKNKDIRLVRRMLDKFPEGLRANSMKAFLERFGQVRFVTEGDKLKDSTLEVGQAIFDATKKLKLGEAIETPWYKAAKEPEYKPLDLDAMIQNVIRLADARLAKGVSKDKGDNIDANKLRKLKALVG